MSDLTHAEAIRIHALRRMAERYGVAAEDGPAILERHQALARLGRFTRLGVRESDGSTVLRMFDRGRTWHMAWRTDWQLVVTYLTEAQAMTNAGLGHLYARRPGACSRRT